MLVVISTAKNNTNILNDMLLSKTQFSKNATQLTSIASELIIKLRFLSINNRIGVNTFLFETEKFELQKQMKMLISYCRTNAQF